MLGCKAIAWQHLLLCVCVCAQESVLQSQLQDALHQLGVAHSQTSKDAAVVVQLQRQLGDHRQQLEELHSHSSEQQGILQQMKELVDKRERELLQCQATDEQLKEEGRRRAALEQELEGAREQLTQALGQLAEEQAHHQGLQGEVGGVRSPPYGLTSTSESCCHPSPPPPLQVEALQSQLDAVRGEAAQLRSAKSQVELQLSEQQLSEQEETEKVRAGGRGSRDRRRRARHGAGR